MKKTLCLFFALLAMSLSACGGNSREETSTHQHSFYDDWTYNENYHWHECSGCTAVDGKEKHSFQKQEVPATYESGGYFINTCTVCGYSYRDNESNKLEHTYSDGWLHDEDCHWHACIDEGFEDLEGNKGRHQFIDEVIAPSFENSGYTLHTCTICGYSYRDNETNKLEHTYSDGWLYDEDCHWHACIDEGYEYLSINKGNHSFVEEIIPPSSANGYTLHTCTICGYSYRDNETPFLSYKITWKNYDDKILEIDEGVRYGDMPSYDGDIPLKPSQSITDYVFSGWSPKVTEVSGDAVYVAQFKEDNSSVIINESNYQSFFRWGLDYRYTSINNNVNPKTVDVEVAIKARKESTPRSFNFIQTQLVVEVPKSISYYNTFYCNITDDIPNSPYSKVVSDYITFYDIDYDVFNSLISYFSVVSVSGIAHYNVSNITSKVSVDIENEEYCTITGGGYYKYGDIYAINISSIHDQCYFAGLYDISGAEPVYLTSYYTYTNVVSSYNVSLKANFVPIEYSITYELDGGINSPHNPKTFNYWSDIPLFDPVRTGYTFKGWEISNSVLIDRIEKGMSSNITLRAIWEWTNITLNLDPDGGMISTNSVITHYEDDYLLPTPYLYGSVFLGWYLDGEKIDNNGIWEDLSSFDFYLKAKWEPQLIIENDIIVDYYDGIKNVIIPDGVIGIADGALSNCSTLESIVIPNSVGYIGESAFENCENLKTIAIPDSVTSIGDSAFKGCTNLDSITMSKNIRSIPSYAFSGCSKLKNIDIPDIVTSIGEYAFDNCAAIINWGQNPSITSFGRRSFYGYKGVSITVPGTIKKIEGTFSVCTNLDSVEILDGVEAIGSYAFDGCINLKTITIPDSVTSIGEYAFYECRSLTSITIPSSVTSIGDYAFENCKSLTSITIPNSVTSIGVCAFDNCLSLTSITIPSSVTYIGISAFESCKKLTIYCAADSKPDDWDYEWNPFNRPVFWSSLGAAQDELFDYVLFTDNTVKVVGYHGTDTEVIIPSSVIINGESRAVISIGQSAFQSCSSLTSITIPDNVTSIGDYAFVGCSSLASITIPSGVTSIGYYAFYGCKKLTIYCGAVQRPSGWDSSWNPSNRPVVWGYHD